ncbi:zinc-finger double domain-containing protein [Phthorimaea operculella]|nr:zinc-finger double domain-containing protein [Phthorimaea operculella]
MSTPDIMHNNLMVYELLLICFSTVWRRNVCLIVYVKFKLCEKMIMPNFVMRFYNRILTFMHSNMDPFVNLFPVWLGHCRLNHHYVCIKFLFFTGLLPPSQTISETTEKQMHDRENYSKLSKKKAKGINKKTNTKNEEGLQSENLNTTRARKKNENKINSDSKNNGVSEKENSKHADGKLDVGQTVSKESTIKFSSNNFSCKKCMFTTDIERVFKSHLNAHSAVKTYTCDKCPYITTIEANLIYHIRKRHTTPDYVCKVCDKKFTTLSALNSHLITHSGEKSSKSRSTDSNHNIAIKKLNTNNEKNNCVNLSTQICDDAALANNKLDERQDILSPDGKECSGLQEKACELTQDLRNYSDLFIAKYSCPQCKYTTNAANLLKSHIQAHSAAKKYICDICSYIAKDKQWLVSHLRTHNGINSKPHTCEICDKKFSERYQLTVHVRTHTGEKPYNCKLCDKKFAYSYGVTLHMKTHTGDKNILV